MAAGAPANSPSRNPSGAAAAKQEASVKPGFQPSAAAQSTASATSSGRIIRTRNGSFFILLKWVGRRLQLARWSHAPQATGRPGADVSGHLKDAADQQNDVDSVYG